MAFKVTALTGYSPSFKSWSSLNQLSPRKWPEVRVKLQGHCTSEYLCGWGCSQRGHCELGINLSGICYSMYSYWFYTKDSLQFRWKAWGAGWALGIWLPQWWRLGRVWGPGPEGAGSSPPFFSQACVLVGGPRLVLDEFSWGGWLAHAGTPPCSQGLDLKPCHFDIVWPQCGLGTGICIWEHSLVSDTMTHTLCVCMYVLSRVLYSSIATRY